MCVQGRHVDVALGTLQQHIGPPGKLSGELRSGAHGRTGLRIRRQRLQEHLSDETVHVRVSQALGRKSGIIQALRRHTPSASRRRFPIRNADAAQEVLLYSTDYVVASSLLFYIIL